MATFLATGGGTGVVVSISDIGESSGVQAAFLACPGISGVQATSSAWKLSSADCLIGL